MKRRSISRRMGVSGLVAIAALAIFAPVLAPELPSQQFADRAFAPPMFIHVRADHAWRRPFIYRQVLDDRIGRRFHDDVAVRVPLRWWSNGHLIAVDAADGPLLLLGADALGRDVFSRMLYGARLSLGVTFLGACGALLLGAAIGALAGVFAGTADALLMLVADFVLVLPGVYLVLVLRAMLPAALTTLEVFWLMVLLFGLAAWPHVARGVRAIVSAERALDYAEASRAAGAGPLHLARQLLPAAHGFLVVELALLVPALLVTEATISFLGLGFPEPAPSWGTMLKEASNVNGLVAAPWTLAPAVLIFFVVLSVQLAGGMRASSNFLLDADTSRRGILSTRKVT